MNYWLKQVELKEISQELTDFFKGMVFADASAALDHFNNVKNMVYDNHPRMNGNFDIKMEMEETSSGLLHVVKIIVREE